MAEDDDDSQKTEEPSQRRLDEARRKGQVAVSRELNHWLMIFALLALVAVLAPAMMRHLAALLCGLVERSWAWPADKRGGLGALPVEILVDAGAALILPALALIAAAVAGPLLQTGPLASADGLKPKLERLSPLAGFKRQFSLRTPVEFAKGLAKLAVVGAVGG